MVAVITQNATTSNRLKKLIKMKQINIIGAGLAGSEAANFLANHGLTVHLYEMRPKNNTEAHHTSLFGELVCSNSLKSSKLDINDVLGLCRQLGYFDINDIAYAPGIAAVMLRRQQATAIIMAREKIVEGAVSMVKMALEKLSEENVVELDDDKKAAMVSNLMVVLCGDDTAKPVMNTGTLNN